MTIAHDPAIQAWLDQEDKRTAQTIRTHGIRASSTSSADMHVQADAVRLHRGALRDRASRTRSSSVSTCTPPTLLLNDVSARVRAGGDLVAGALLTFDGWAHRATVETIPNPAEIVFAANRFYQRPDECSVPMPSNCTLRRPSWPVPVGRRRIANAALESSRAPGEFRAD